MPHLVRDRKVTLLGWWMLFTMFALVVCLSSCSKPSKPAAAEAQTYASPNDAGKALLAAAKSGNQDAIVAIFGPESKEIIDSGDPIQTKETINAFAAAYETMNRWRKMDDKTEMLVIGVDNFDFPIPLTKNGAGRWFFDTAAGKDEILSRRIGRNELAAIDICAAIANAQGQYFSQHHDGAKQYAQKFISDEGKQNGLYWPSAEGQPKSPLGPLVVFATSEGYQAKADQHQAFHGYFYKMLDKQGTDVKGGAKSYLVNGKMIGGFAVVAHPAEYGDSGIMTFLIDQSGVVYQKDLGKTTKEVAGTMTEFNPDGSWKAVE